MHRDMNKTALIALLLGISAMPVPGTVSALTQWAFNDTNCLGTSGTTGGTCATDSLSSYREYGGSGGAGSVEVSGWANTSGSANTLLGQGQITHYYTSGLGVKNADAYSGDTNEGTSPEHAIDNNERFDMVLFDFGDQLVELSQITLGWWSGDSDISVLAYTGSAEANQSASELVDGRTLTAASQDLTANGWSIIGNHDVDNENDGSTPVGVQNINAGKVASSYWLISAYNPAFGSDCTPANNYCQADNPMDYFKIAAVAGTVQDAPPPPPSSEPASAPAPLLLMYAGFGYLLRRKRS